MRRQATLPALALPALLLAACSDGSADAIVFADVDTIAGRIEVANTGKPIWTAETAWRLEEDLWLGRARRRAPSWRAASTWAA